MLFPRRDLVLETKKQKMEQKRKRKKPVALGNRELLKIQQDASSDEIEVQESTEQRAHRQ
jgi:hypothetical protein